VRLSRLLTVLGRAVVQQLLLKLRLRPFTPMRVGHSQPSPVVALNLQPGEMVRIKSREQIRATLDQRCRNQGVSLDDENLPYCGRTLRVRQRMDRYINDVTGEMTHLETPWVILDTAVCTGEYSLGRWFCPRGAFTQWSEGWLERTDASSSTAISGQTQA
jgi:hypothetical protein